MTAAPFQTFLARALADGHAEITGEGRNERIHYLAAGPVIYSGGAMKMPYFVIECKRAAIRKCHQTLWEGGRRSPIAAFG